MQIDSEGVANNDYNDKHELDLHSTANTSNWKDCGVNQVNKYIEYLLTENNFHQNENDILSNQF